MTALPFCLLCIKHLSGEKESMSLVERIASFVILPLLIVTLSTIANGQRVRHVVVVGVDGMGAEGLARVDPPNMRRLRHRGAWTLKGRGIIPTVSAPNWASMIMGASPVQHGVTSNEWRADNFEIAPICKDGAGFFPSIFSLLREQRPKSVIGVFHHWEGFGNLFNRKSVDLTISTSTPSETMEKAGRFLIEKKPTLTFIHLDDVDHAGHADGWLSPRYDEAIREADRLIGELLV